MLRRHDVAMGASCWAEDCRGAVRPSEVSDGRLDETGNEQTGDE